MKAPGFDPSWPESWQSSFRFDREEIFGPITNRGYAYAYANRRRATLDLICKTLAPGSTILDIAAAQGNFSLTLAERGYRLTWNDLRAELADYVRLKHEAGVVAFAPGNAFELSFPEFFDAVLITEVIEHVAHPDDFLQKIAALVKPGGYVIMTTPNGGYFRNRLPRFSDFPDPSIFESVQFKPDSDGHIFLLYRDEIKSLAQSAGLKIERLELITTPLTAGHMKMSNLLHVVPRAVIDQIERTCHVLPIWLKDKLMLTIAARLRKNS